MVVLHELYTKLLICSFNTLPKFTSMLDLELVFQFISKLKLFEITLCKTSIQGIQDLSVALYRHTASARVIYKSCL